MATSKLDNPCFKVKREDNSCTRRRIRRAQQRKIDNEVLRDSEKEDAAQEIEPQTVNNVESNCIKAEEAVHDESANDICDNTTVVTEESVHNNRNIFELNDDSRAADEAANNKGSQEKSGETEITVEQDTIEETDVINVVA